MVHALGSVKDEPSSLCICGHDVQCVESFVYLGAMIHSSCSSDSEIRRCSATTRSTMQSLDRHLWRSRIMNKTKLHLYMAFIIPTMLCGSECWAINNADMQWIDAVDQWCLRRILDIRWHDSVRNADIRRITSQPPLSSIIKSVVSLSTGILQEWMRTQMLAKPSSNLLQNWTTRAAAHNLSVCLCHGAAA